MPGDEIVPQASFNATRAITIGVSPDHVWPWLVQLGFGRAGWYSYDLFDNAVAWTLTPLGSGRETRLVTRIRQYYDWRRSPANALLTLTLFELGDFPMMRKLLLGVRERAEGLAVGDTERS